MTDTSKSLAWRLHWYRQSELEGALLLGRMVRICERPGLLRSLTRHAGEEAQHAVLWTETLDRLRLPFVRIRRSYQSFYTDQGGIPTSLPEVLAFTHAFERRVDTQFRIEIDRLERSSVLTDSGSALVRRTFATMLADERRHLTWIADWLASRSDGEALLARYEAIDTEVHRRLVPFECRLWDVEGLGVEVEPESGDDECSEVASAEIGRAV